MLQPLSQSLPAGGTARLTAGTPVAATDSAAFAQAMSGPERAEAQTSTLLPAGPPGAPLARSPNAQRLQGLQLAIAISRNPGDMAALAAERSDGTRPPLQREGFTFRLGDSGTDPKGQLYAHWIEVTGRGVEQRTAEGKVVPLRYTLPDAPVGITAATAMARRSEPTPREMEVLRLRAQGFTQVEVAKELGISAQAVSKHEERAFRRLRATSLEEVKELLTAKDVQPRPVQPGPAHPCGLTEREMEAMRLRGGNLTLRQVGDLLGLTTQAVARREARALEKLGVTSLQEGLERLRAEGALPPPPLGGG